MKCDERTKFTHKGLGLSDSNQTAMQNGKFTADGGLR
jgi:hypothetical protein